MVGEILTGVLVKKLLVLAGERRVLERRLKQLQYRRNHDGITTM